MTELSPVVIIAGPTASGKSALALTVAEEFGGEIVNADSMQVYRDLQVLTARPDEDDLARVPHHLFGVLPASERCSAGRWLDMAAPVLDDIRARGKLPVVCGGTGLYLKALTDGLAPVPPVPEDLVAGVEAHFEAVGGEAFLAELAKIDPEAASRLPATDRQRLVRAAAVFAATGRTLSDWHTEQPAGPGYAARYFTLLMLPPRAALYQRIEERFDAMISLGAMAEAEAFHALGLDPSLPASRAVGVAELLRVLNGEWDLETAVTKAKTASRNLAKRQFTWFRRQIHSDFVLSEKFLESQKEKIFSFIRQFLLTSFN